MTHRHTVTLHIIWTNYDASSCTVLIGHWTMLQNTCLHTVITHASQKGTMAKPKETVCLNITSYARFIKEVSFQLQDNNAQQSNVETQVFKIIWQSVSTNVVTLTVMLSGSWVACRLLASSRISVVTLAPLLMGLPTKHSINPPNGLHITESFIFHTQSHKHSLKYH